MGGLLVLLLCWHSHVFEYRYKFCHFIYDFFHMYLKDSPKIRNMKTVKGKKKVEIYV